MVSQGTAASLEEVSRDQGARFGSALTLAYHRKEEPPASPVVQAAAIERQRARIAQICSWDPGFDLDVDEMLRQP